MAKRGLIVSTMFCIASLLLMGCASSQPTRFFVLNAIESARQEPAQPCRNDASMTIGINPVSVPRYLDRPQIMTKVSANEFKLSELNVWAEPLTDNLSRVMAQNLGHVPCARVVTIPKALSRTISHRLSTEVMRLEGTLGGQALLEVQWSITDELSKQVLHTRTSTYTEPVGSNDYHALVQAYNRLIDTFSREAADAFISISQGKTVQ